MTSGPNVPCLRALFLDRDGVINVNHGYVHSRFNFEFVEGIFDLVRCARSFGYRIVVVTNQSGIARGYYSEEQFCELTSWMCGQFERRGARVDKVYYSPYHPTEGLGKYLLREDTRKPGPGMLLRAQRELGLSLRQSILIGDQPSDVKAGIAAGVGVNLFYSDESPAALAGLDCIQVSTLMDAMTYLTGSQSGLRSI
jgi:D-glycero-D-manno-heptose 1,7-bisphosphate phosphatase